MSEEFDNEDQPANDYKVGYGKPPRETRFEKGRSGNPSGRPRRGGSMAEIMEAELRTPIIVKENGKRRKIDARRALAKSLKTRALQGDMKAHAQLVKYAEAIDAKAEARRPKIPPDASPTLVNRLRFMMTLFKELHEIGIVKGGNGKALLDLTLFVLDDDTLAESLRSLNEKLSQFNDPY